MRFRALPFIVRPLAKVSLKHDWPTPAYDGTPINIGVRKDQIQPSASASIQRGWLGKSEDCQCLLEWIPVGCSKGIMSMKARKICRGKWAICRKMFHYDLRITCDTMPCLCSWRTSRLQSPFTFEPSEWVNTMSASLLSGFPRLYPPTIVETQPGSMISSSCITTFEISSTSSRGILDDSIMRCCHRLNNGDPLLW